MLWKHLKPVGRFASAGHCGCGPLLGTKVTPQKKLAPPKQDSVASQEPVIALTDRQTVSPSRTGQSTPLNPSVTVYEHTSTPCAIGAARAVAAHAMRAKTVRFIGGSCGAAGGVEGTG